MRKIGIIAEYNPFHNGHKYQIERLRAQNDEICIVCAMSGNFTERGEAALTGKYNRAKNALLCGADLVIEIPFPFSSGSAEYFAMGGVSALLAAGVETINFGSECGDAEKLRAAADITLSQEFRRLYDEKAHGESGSAAAYFECLRELGCDDEFGSNDILGIEYIKAAKRLSADISFSCVKREGSEYLSKVLESDKLPSASAIRNSIETEGLDSIVEYVPDATLKILETAEEDGETVERRRFEDVVLAFLRTSDRERLSGIAEMGGGLANRILSAAREAGNYREFFNLVSTKKYTDSRIRRALLFAMCGVLESDLKAEIPYFDLLGADERGRELLAALRRDERNAGKIITKPADAKSLGSVAERAVMLKERADSLYTLCLHSPKDAGYYFRQSAVIIGER